MLDGAPCPEWFTLPFTGLQSRPSLICASPAAWQEEPWRFATRGATDRRIPHEFSEETERGFDLHLILFDKGRW
jgi:hypothetical protein